MTSRDISVQDALAALVQGKVGTDISVEDACEAARLCGLFLLSALRVEVGSLDRVRSVVEVVGCSKRLVDVFGDEVGRHARSAVGMAELPLNVPVEIEMVVAVATG